MGRTLGSALTLSIIGLGSKLAVKWLAKRFDVRGLPTLLNALKEPNLRKGKEKDELELPRTKRRGIVTICNHNSVVDDPFMWTMLPNSHFLPLAGPSRVSRMNRWTLGASDVMFTNRLFSRFFNNGQVIETIRGGGIFQPAVDKAIELLQDGEWIHIFPEGKINQITINPPGGLKRFKWGVGRIIMDADTMPEIIPIWISRFDTMMPETRGWPRPVPRKGGNPLVEEWKARHKTVNKIEDKDIHAGRDADEGERDLRIQICEALQDSLRKLGQEVEGAEGRFESGEWSNSKQKLTVGGKEDGGRSGDAPI